MANRGKKDCPNCKQEIGARCLVCPECGYHYESKTIRKDLLKNKDEKKEISVFTEGGKGKKECPSCHVFVGAVTKICPKCDHDFSSAKKEVKEEKKEAPVKKDEEEVNSLTKKILARESANHHICKVEITCKMTPQEHANRILSYGKERAMALLNFHEWYGGWGHVDWKIVREGLAEPALSA